jgi:hypothetical protein
VKEKLNKGVWGTGSPAEFEAEPQGFACGSRDNVPALLTLNLLK